MGSMPSASRRWHASGWRVCRSHSAAADRAAGHDYDLSILQAEFARTQVFDRPLSGRHLFEEIIRENLDLGRPEQISLLFDRRITRRAPRRFRTRVDTHGVRPSLHIDD